MSELRLIPLAELKGLSSELRLKTLGMAGALVYRQEALQALNAAIHLCVTSSWVRQTS